MTSCDTRSALVGFSMRNFSSSISTGLHVPKSANGLPLATSSQGRPVRRAFPASHKGLCSPWLENWGAYKHGRSRSQQQLAKSASNTGTEPQGAENARSGRQLLHSIHDRCIHIICPRGGSILGLHHLSLPAFEVLFSCAYAVHVSASLAAHIASTCF